MRDLILKSVSLVTNIPVDVLTSKKRNRPITEARGIYYINCRKFTEYCHKDIGRFVGNKDHATVIHGIKTTNDLIDTNIELRSKNNMVKSIIEKAIKEGFVESISLERQFEIPKVADLLKLMVKDNFTVDDFIKLKLSCIIGLMEQQTKITNELIEYLKTKQNGNK